MKKTTLMISVVLMFFILLGAVSAAELGNVTNTESSNLMLDNDELSMSNFEDNNENLILESASDSDNALQKDALDIEQTASGNTSKNTTKVNTKLSVYNSHYGRSSTVVKVSLKDNNGGTIANKTLSLKLNGKTYKATTNEKGLAYFKAPALKQGKYTITTSFAGDSQYIKSSLSKKLKVASSISSSDMKITYGDNKNYTSIFYKNTGYFQNGTVKISLNGKTYLLKTNSKGVAQISLANLLPGTYAIQLFNSYSKETIKKTLTVNKASSKITSSKKYLLPKSKSTYSVVLKNNNNKALKNAKIYFTYNNKKVTATTDSTGKATISIPVLPVGPHIITFKYNGNNKYKSASGYNKLYVKNSTVSLTGNDLKMQYNDGSSYAVTVKNSTGHTLANKVIKFTFNGKTDKVTTDKNGVAKLSIGNLKPGTYALKATHSTKGLRDYNIHKGKVIISKQTINIVANDFVMKYNSGSSYQVILKDKFGANLKGVEVKFTFNGKSTTANTDANGIAKLAVTEKMGYYPVDIEVNTANYTSSKVTKHILVNGTSFTAKNISVPANTASTFEVKVLDGQNKPVKTTVKFTLNNKVQSVKTDDNGVAKLAISGLALTYFNSPSIALSTNAT